uniref:Fibronectin type 3 and ankyrin repeat domains protein 1 n=1 Tax=Aegilops tauschii TaxID=37682 RepID=M8BTN2_AEGTA
MEAPFVYLRPTVEDDGTGGDGTRTENQGWEEIGGEESVGDFCVMLSHAKAIWRFAGATPFMLSAQSGHVSTVKYFLDHGGDLVKGLNKGRTVLHHAVCIGCCKVTEFLLSKGVPVDIDCGHGTPLYMAAINEQDKTVKILLDHHANPNIIISGANSPLMSALVYRSLKCMKLLIKVLCKSYNELGRLPVELAAIRDCMEEVEMLFPVTSPIPNVPNWSIEGVISHAKIEEKKPIEQRHLERRKSLFKSHADKAFKQKDYKMATKFYDLAIEHAESATLYANRSLCKLLMDDGEGALSDALMCRMLRPDWAKACYHQGAAHMLLKEYKQACDALLDAQNLDPGNADAEIKGELRKARELMKNPPGKGEQ